MDGERKGGKERGVTEETEGEKDKKWIFSDYLK